MRKVIYLCECGIVLVVYGLALVTVAWHPLVCLVVGSLVTGVYLADGKAIALGRSDARISRRDGRGD